MVGLIYTLPCTFVCVMLGLALIDEKITTVDRLSPVNVKHEVNTVGRIITC